MPTPQSKPQPEANPYMQMMQEDAPADQGNPYSLGPPDTKAPPPAPSQPGMMERVGNKFNEIMAPPAANESGLNRFSHEMMRSAITPFAHPLNTIGSTIKAITEPPWQAALEMAAPYAQSPHPLTDLAADTTGGAADAAALSLPFKALAPVGGALREGAAGLNNAVIGTPGKAFRFGANPGEALSTNRIMGSTPGVLASQVEEKIPGAASEHRGIIANMQGNQKINTGPLINEPFDTRIQAGTNPRTGAASPAQIGAATRTRTQLTHVPTDTGQATPMMRDPNLSPLEATELKSNLYPRINYDAPNRYSISNDALRSGAHNLKNAVDVAVPEQIPAGQRLHNLMSAKDILEPSSRGQKLNLSKSGLIDRAGMLAGTTGAAGADIAGARLQNLLHAPPLVPLVNQPQKKVKQNGSGEDDEDNQ